ncbi:gene transfer agent family protein [Novosphingobium sp. KCTC 2891]|uniref:gene transfer agent family protein n=1 Tax=Novosphingobium sp. KCTC 2891 TaxID=2989730 RepID=UPI002221AB87|nr:gene transfer agent family protein [Novosphingobium sp. KCTC 2891]MCW1383214.1 gene transfer agent family protein [Novosphingobium sp. KCTC 2891]
MSAPANPHRGEAMIVLGGVEHVLRPSFGALVAAEEELGPLFTLVERASEGRLALREMAALFWHCLRDRKDTDRDSFAEALARAGLAACAPVLRALLVQVLKGAA